MFFPIENVGVYDTVQSYPLEWPKKKSIVAPQIKQINERRSGKDLQPGTQRLKLWTCIFKLDKCRALQTIHLQASQAWSTLKLVDCQMNHETSMICLSEVELLC